MMNDEVANKRIAELFRSLPWQGVAPLEEAIRQAQEYRIGLSADERLVFDEEIAEGQHPSYAMHLVELMSEREAETTGRSFSTIPAIAKAS